MSVKEDVRELESLRLELKNLSKNRKELKKREKILQGKIGEFLKSKEQVGLKHKGTAIILEKKEKHKQKNKKQVNEDTLAILRDSGIQNPEHLMLEILNARKGELIEEETLKMKKYKE